MFCTVNTLAVYIGMYYCEVDQGLGVLCLCTCQAFPGPPLLLYTSNHSSMLRIFEYCGWNRPELLQESCP